MQINPVQEYLMKAIDKLSVWQLTYLYKVESTRTHAVEGFQWPVNWESRLHSE